MTDERPNPPQRPMQIAGCLRCGNLGFNLLGREYGDIQPDESIEVQCVYCGTFQWRVLKPRTIYVTGPHR